MAITIQGQDSPSIQAKPVKLLIDFTGTSPQGNHNYNAPSAVCKAAVLYVFRTLVDDEIPLNEGCLKPLKIKIPPKSIISPEFPAAVIAGNTEVSQCLTDALYGALGVLASAQGTMNNFVYGNEIYQNYETICGGTGAGNGFDGVDAVHSHMTNTRMTDSEVLENRFPVRVEEFSIRHGSGGKGPNSRWEWCYQENEIPRKHDCHRSIQSSTYRPLWIEGGWPWQARGTTPWCGPTAPWINCAGTMKPRWHLVMSS